MFTFKYTATLGGDIQYIYLLSGSSVTYDFCAQSNETDYVPQAQFFVFNDRSKYLEYVFGQGNGKKMSVYIFVWMLGWIYMCVSVLLSVVRCVLYT